MAEEIIKIVVTGIVETVRNAPGTGQDAFVYIAYADDEVGTGFTNTFHPDKSYIAIKSTTVPIETPVAGDFEGLWKSFGGSNNSIEVAATRAAISASANRRFILVQADENNGGTKSLLFYDGSELINIITA
jgi:hypothetical protein